MDNQPDKSNRSLILYFVLSVVFAFLGILASKLITVTYFLSDVKITLNLKWMFWLSTMLSIAFILPIIRSLLVALHQQGRLPKILDWFFREEFVEKSVSSIRLIQNVYLSTIGRLVLSGLGIFLLTMAVWRSGAIHETEIDSNLLTIVDAAAGRYSYSREGAFPTVELCSYFRPQSGNYLRNCLKLVTDLKAVGVKVVVLAMRPLAGSKDEFGVIRELEETGIVVFATEYGRMFWIAGPTGVLILSPGRVTMSDREVEETSRLVRLRPAGLENVGSPRSLDISIEILRRYKGYGNEIPWIEEGGEFRFGDYRIPVTKDGWMYSRDRGFSWPSLLDVDSTRSWYIPNRPKSSKDFSQKAIKAGLKIEDDRIPVQDAGTQLKGKIVLLTDSFGPPGSYLISRAYQSAIENILTGALIRKWEMGHLWVSVLCLVLAGLITYRVRLVVAFLILLALLPCVLMFGWYLYASHSILIDMFYPLLSTAMAIVVFPVIVMGRQPDLRKDDFV
ncbi:MAG: hypothetical protein ABSE41_04605 [Bacteroidota bacterium]|jgi:hypothetical protein